MSKYFYSIIVPVYNRPDEVEELLDSILKLENPNSDPLNYEVIIVEDGSTTPCKDIVDKYSESFSIQYYILEKNTGNPIIPKNTGADYSKGNFLIFLDSDVILPPAYLINVNNAILNNELDAFSGPDMAHSSFNTMQKATSYSMTSFLTTGGIRNKKKNVSGKISFRGYNCGVRKDVFMQVGKYPHIMPSEDILLGYNIVSANYKLGFIENAAVYHKRKTSLKKYWKQVFTFGKGRVNLNRLIPNNFNLVHILPSMFIFFCLLSIFASFFCYLAITPLLFYTMLILLDAGVKNKNFKIGFLSIITSYIQHFGYGFGYIYEKIFSSLEKQSNNKYQF